MKAKIKVITEIQRQHAIKVLEQLPLDVIHTVEIKPFKKDRSLDQNALYWQWLTIIGNELGESKETLHERYKDGFLVQIYERDNPEYAEMVQALREVWKHGMKNEAISLRKRIVALTSTTTATTSQMAEYMTEVERRAAELGIRLPHPEDDI